MTPSFEAALRALKKLPGLGYRSSERIALHLLVEKPESLNALLVTLQEAAQRIQACQACGNLAEGSLCAVCSNTGRDQELLCVVETVSDLQSIEQSGAFRGCYHVLHGKLSPIKGIHPEHLNIASLQKRFELGEISEVVLALSNDIEGEATCHYLQESIKRWAPAPITLSRIGFGIPSGGGVIYADSATLRSALEGRRHFAS